MQKTTDFARKGVKAGPCPAYVRPWAEEAPLLLQALLCQSISGDFDDIVDDEITI